jgi:hypothetical protein
MFDGIGGAPMTTLWDRQIRHITRSVKPTPMRGVRGQLIKADIKARKGLPSRNLPAELAFERIRLAAGRVNGSTVDEFIMATQSGDPSRHSQP